MSLFPIPVGVANRLETSQRELFWGGLGEEKKFQPVNWNLICNPILSGGLGFNKLVVFNKELFGKWLWRYMKERDSFWRIFFVINIELPGMDGVLMC